MWAQDKFGSDLLNSISLYCIHESHSVCKVFGIDVTSSEDFNSYREVGMLGIFFSLNTVYFKF